MQLVIFSLPTANAAAISWGWLRSTTRSVSRMNSSAAFRLGSSIAAITTGGFVVELVFAIPGLGRYFVQAVQQLDYTVIMGTTVFYGAFLVLMVIIVDLLYGLIDPRMRLE